MPTGQNRKSKHHLNLSAFAEPLSAEARYWVGFLLADGCIGNSKGFAVIRLALKFEDAEHVRKFARFVGVSEESVREFDGGTNFGRSHRVQVQFTGKELITQLAKYGVVPRKTKTASVPPSLAHDPDFWRGLVDGDGSVGKCRGYNTIYLCGTLAIVEGFRDICHIIVGFRPALRSVGSIFQANLGCAKATKLLHWLYYPGAVALERKANAWR